MHSMQPGLQDWHFPEVPKKKLLGQGIEINLQNPSFNSYLVESIHSEQTIFVVVIPAADEEAELARVLHALQFSGHLLQKLNPDRLLVAR